MKILIMAGGKGTRLWPLSRMEKPKQFQKLISDKTMLQETIFRMLPLGGWEDVYISTTPGYVDEVKKELPKIKKENIISEPKNRERASSIALSCAFFTKRHPKETVVVLPSDHLVKNSKALLSTIRKANKVLEKNPGYLMTIGINPRAVDTGLGYIKKGKPFQEREKTSGKKIAPHSLIKKGSALEDGGSNIFKVDGFTEKPDLKTAQKFVKSGSYFWNSGIYLFKPEYLLEKYRKFVPDTYKRALKIREVIDMAGYKNVLEEEYPKMDPVSFEYSIAENDDKILMVTADLGWSDIGSWAVLKDSLVKHNSKNFVKAAHLDIGSEDILVYGSPKKLIATVGLKGLVIVDTNDVILICDKSRSQEVKEIVNMLEKVEGEKHL